MAITVLKRPQGFKLNSTAVSATVGTDAGGALITKTAHGLNTGDYIYLTSTLEQYNGFWYVNKKDANGFYLQEYSSASNVAFVNSGSVTYYLSILTHKWNCVHLPIQYKFSNNLWPTNSVDTIQNVSSTSSDGGYHKLNLAGDIKSSGQAQELEWVKMVGVTDVNGNSLDGIYQIINYVSDTTITIDLPYSSGNVFAGGPGNGAQYYYMNYNVRVRIYAGIQVSHPWTSIKPPAQICEIKEVPDSNGLITFYINEYLKKQIDIFANNLTLDTLPNNIDAWCNFYITYAESYDKSSSGYTLGTFTSSYTDDSGTFTGTAINAKLAFKNIYAGWPSAYLYGSAGNPGAFLTKFTSPTIFPNNYLDISFALNETVTTPNAKLVQERYHGISGIDGTTTTVITTLASNYGIYRMQISRIGTEDRQIIYVSDGTNILIAPITVNISTDCYGQSINLGWLNNLGGFDYWVFTAQKTYGTDIDSTVENETDITVGWPNSFGDKADTILSESSRESRDNLLITAQYVTQDQLNAILNIKKSPLVQIINSATDRRIIILDKNSFTWYEDQDKTFTINFSARYTDKNSIQEL